MTSSLALSLHIGEQREDHMASFHDSMSKGLVVRIELVFMIQ